MPFLGIIELVALISFATVVLWAIGRQGLEMGDVFRTLFSNKPGPDRPSGVQEEDDPWRRDRPSDQR